ncbi:MAG: Na+/H+ antiporter NhaC [Pirellulales bacterium]|nr:Na+/H+ antiporter NhaC [Pirellulales bacterium]
MKRKPTLVEAMIPLAAIVVFLGVGYGYLRLEPEILLIAGATVAGLVARRLGYTYKEILAGVVEMITKGMPAMLIIICVGALIGSWIAAGTTPMLIYYGLKIISPASFLVTSCILCSIVSVLTGTSWGTIGTMGIALIGIAEGLGIPPGQAAGAIVAGAYFGDKLSPFSDTTNLASMAARSNLFDHIRHMLWTTVPSWLLGLVVYFLIGLFSHAGAEFASTERINVMSAVLRSTFAFNPFLLLPVAITLYCAVRQKPVVPSLLLSAAAAAVLAIVCQGSAVREAVNSLVVGYLPETGDVGVDELLARGGLRSMMTPTLMAICAFSFGGIMQSTGMLGVLLEKLLKYARTTGQLIASTVACCVLTAAMTGEGYLSILIPGELFAPAFRKRNLAAKNLSRTTEDSGTVVIPLIPWSMSAVYVAGTLHVKTFDYLPWAIMCYTGMFFALFYGFTGIAVAPRTRDDETAPGS